MIPAGVDVFVALDPIDLRWSFDRLAGIAEEQVGRSARGGALFVFFGKRRTAVKILFADATGICLFYKRLDRGTFRLPEALEAGGKSVALDERALDDLLDGIDLDAAPKRARKKPAAPLH
jgi:transposase